MYRLQRGLHHLHPDDLPNIVSHRIPASANEIKKNVTNREIACKRATSCAATPFWMVKPILLNTK